MLRNAQPRPHDCRLTVIRSIFIPACIFLHAPVGAAAPAEESMVAQSSPSAARATHLVRLAGLPDLLESIRRWLGQGREGMADRRDTDRTERSRASNDEPEQNHAGHDRHKRREASKDGAAWKARGAECRTDADSSRCMNPQGSLATRRDPESDLQSDSGEAGAGGSQAFPTSQPTTEPGPSSSTIPMRRRSDALTSGTTSSDREASSIPTNRVPAK